MKIFKRLRDLWSENVSFKDALHANMRAENARIVLNKRVEFEMGLGGVRLPEIADLGHFASLFIKVDGIAFHDGRKQTLINAVDVRRDLAQERAEKISTWSERDGVVAVVDAKGEMYMARAHYLGNDQRMHSIANVLEEHRFARAGWPVPIDATDVAVGRIDYNVMTRQKAQLSVHRKIQTHLGRPAYERIGQLERFMKNAEPPPGAPKRTVTIDGPNIFVNM